MKISVLGAGGFGTALSVMISANKHDTTLWSAVESEIEDIKANKENTKLLKGVKVDTENIELTTNIEDIKDSEVVIFAVASDYLRETAKKASKFIPKNAIIVNVAKGLEDKTFKILSQVIEEQTDNKQVVALSGPSHAEEVARNIPTTIVATSKNIQAAEKIQEILSSDHLRIYLNDDTKGVQLGGALKNVVAMAAGICDGLGYGDNTKAALITRGMTEIKRSGIKAGGKEETFFGLSGIGDLIVTCTSIHSRNYRAGYKIGQGKSPDLAIKEISMTVEGYRATKTANELSKIYDVSMPITQSLYRILYENKSPKEEMIELMNRPFRHESEKSWLKEQS